MSRLEDLQPNTAVRGVLPDRLVTVVTVQWFGSDALELTYKDPGGKVANTLLYRDDELRLEVVEQGRPWSFDGDGHLFREAAKSRETTDSSYLETWATWALRHADQMDPLVSGDPFVPERVPAYREKGG